MLSLRMLKTWFLIVGLVIPVMAEESPSREWNDAPELLRPFWEGDTVVGESMLFVRDAAAVEARASVLFPIVEVLSVQNSAGDVTYEQGRDYIWEPGTREIMLLRGSRIPSRTPLQLRRLVFTHFFEIAGEPGM